MRYDKQALAALDGTVLDWRYRSIAEPSLRLADVASREWDITADDVLLPAAVLRAEAVSHNIGLMRDYCRQAGVELAPHAKTHMSPQLLAQQVDAGAWAVTVATVAQARVLRAFGFDRILIANEVSERSAVRWIAETLEDPDVDMMCLVDDPHAATDLNEHLREMSAPRPLPVLVEVGYAGGRAGARDLETALAVAWVVSRSSHLSLAGVEGFEGLLAFWSASEEDLAAVRAYLAAVVKAARAIDELGLFENDHAVLSAGGSSVFDMVVEAFTSADLDTPTRCVLRSGCYVTHDHGPYRITSPLDGRGEGRPRLRPALEVWAPVLSRPEPDHVIVGMGKRDVASDSGLPVPLRSWRSGEPVPIGDDATTVALNDQHALLKIANGTNLKPGDRLVFGTSHPCGTFDRWPILLVVDERNTVVDAYLTFF